GVPLLDQALDHGYHLIDVCGCPRLDGRRERTQSGHILVEGTSGALGYLLDGLAARPCRGDDLVIDVGDIAGIGDLLWAVEVAQQAKEHVEHHDGSGVPDVREVVDGGSTDIETHVFSVFRLKDFALAAQGVV